MTPSTALVTASTDFSLDESIRLGQVLAESGFFSDARGAAQAVAKILAGKELGFGPIASMTGINIIKGRVTMSANLMAAAVQRSGRFGYRIVTLNDEGCELAFFEDGEQVGTAGFTAEDAKRAGLLGGENYRKYPSDMFFARAMSRGTRRFCPAVFGGPVYTPDELDVEVTDDGEVVGEIVVQVPTEPPTAVPYSSAAGSWNVRPVDPQATVSPSAPEPPAAAEPEPVPEAPELQGPSERQLTGDEGLALAEFMDASGLRASTQRMMLIEVGVEDTEHIDRALSGLSVGQALRVRELVRAKATVPA